MLRALDVVILVGLSGCADELPSPSLVDNLRILAVRAEPPEGPVGTEVSLDALVLHPDLDHAVEQAWIACVILGESAETSCLEVSTTVPPLCTSTEDSDASLCTIGVGETGTYQLPALALEGTAQGESAQVVVTLAVASVEDGGLLGCLEELTATGAEPEFCRLAVKRVTVLADGTSTTNHNPTLVSMSVDGTSVVVALSPDSTEETDSGPEELFLSWYTTSGSLEEFRTDANDLQNTWTPEFDEGTVAVVVHDSRGGVGWIRL